MSEIKSYRDLIVWQRSMDLTDEIYKLVRLLPKSERDGLSDQMRRAVVSIPSNIAEGQARNSSKEFLHFLSIANGSCAELRTQLEISVRQSMLTREQIRIAYHYCNEIEKMLFSITYQIKQKT